MSYVDYEKAQKAGLKAFKNAVAKGENEYLPVLDEILEDVDIVSEVNLGLVQIPLDRVVGTSNVGRTYAFANNFMPLLDYNTEFGAKWSSLCDSHVEEGIREPIKAYEYMNKFYVVEGNKRVSVLKYFDAVSVPAQVTRKIPRLTNDPQIKLYYEFMDFYKLTEINYIWFSQPGCFKKLLELTCEDPTKEWTDEQKKDFASANHNFCKAFASKNTKKLPITLGDAFLIFIDIYGYDNIKNLLEPEMKKMIDPLWDEFKMENSNEIQLRMEPSKIGKKKLTDYLWSPTPKRLMVAFVFDKDPKESDWLYAHELGRLYIDEKYPGKVKTIKVHNLYTEEDIYTAMEDLVMMGVNVIFTTSSKQIAPSLKVAANHPEVKVLNCSLNTSHKIIRTYYARLYEVKFLAGMITGILAKSDKIGYLADYPIIGTPANINAFALGVKMVNPYASVVLKWSTIKGLSRERVLEEFKNEGIRYVSDQINMRPGEQSRRYGLYCIDEDTINNIALPIYNWGALYEKIIESMLSGTYDQDDDRVNQAINYWWGLSAGVVDIICSSKVPDATKRLVDTFKRLIVDKEFVLFADELIDNEGIVRNTDGNELSPSDVMKMNWLLDNVIGDIPELDELKDEVKPIVEIKGVTDENTSAG